MSLFNSLKSSTLLSRFRRDESGSILVELAVSIPLFLTLLTGVVEVGNYLLMTLKVQHTVISVSDLVTRDEDITEGVMADIFQAVPQIMAPFPTGERSVAIVSAISQNEDTPASVFWQRAGGGSYDAASTFGAEGDPVDLPAGLTLRDNETILATEVYYRYEPLVFDFILPKTIRKVAYFRPRIGSLQEIEP